MKYGIEPTHMQELRRKQWLRLFVEERIVDAQLVLLYLLEEMYNLYTLTLTLKGFIVNNKKYAAIVLFAATVFVTMIL